MKFIVLLFFIVIIDILFINSPVASEGVNTLSNEKEFESTEEHKLLLECQHSDYRTYIKCLKRQKRHHGQGDHHNDTGGSKTCFEDCGIDLCTSTRCVHDCHTRCMKRTKETRQIITQYETDCGSDDCNNKAELPTTNITTNIDINNVINNHIPKNPSIGNADDSGSGTCSSCGGTVGSKGGDVMTFPGGTGGGFGLALVPQIQLVPQISYGIGMTPIGRCLTSMNWPCIPSMQQSNIDCSQCSNPFLRYRCDALCYQLGNNPINPIGTDLTRGGSNLTCRTPHCVGGTY